jgi:hypothetical protein
VFATAAEFVEDGGVKDFIPDLMLDIVYNSGFFVQNTSMQNSPFGRGTFKKTTT